MFLFSSSELRNLSRLVVVLIGLTPVAWTLAADVPDPAPVPEQARGTAASAQENEELEKALQALPWDQFRSVVTAIPKLKADVDAYGPLGWQYVQANYRTYRWRKNIGKLQEPQKKRLAELIGQVRDGARPAN